MTQYRHGIILGTFLPPHRGHQFMVHFSQGLVDLLSLLVWIRPGDAISGNVRCAWLTEMFPDAKVVPITIDNPSAPAEHPEFWGLWRDTINLAAPEADVLFASEEYGWTLANVLGIDHIPVDPSRLAVPITGSRIRSAPYHTWDYLPEPVRGHLACRVALIGPPGSGKSSLGRDLATEFGTVCAPDFLELFLKSKAGPGEYSDLDLILTGQQATHRTLRRQANRLLLIDSDLLSLMLWAKSVFGECPPDLTEACDSDSHDYYLLLAPDSLQEGDSATLSTADFTAWERELTVRGLRYDIVSGTREEIREKATDLVHDFLSSFNPLQRSR